MLLFLKRVLYKITYQVVSSTPGTQTTSSAVLSSSIPSSTPTSSELCSFPWYKILIQNNLQGSSTTLPVSSNPTRSSSRLKSPQLDPIVGGVVAIFGLILIIIFLLLKLQASRRENRLRAEINPILTPFNRDLVDTRGELGRNLKFNDYGSEMPRRTGALCFIYTRSTCQCHPHIVFSSSSLRLLSSNIARKHFLETCTYQPHSISSDAPFAIK